MPVYNQRRAETNQWEAKGTVERRRRINLEDMPWPMNILKFNQAVSEMKPGDHMIAFLKDADVMANLLRLLRHRPDMKFTTSTSDEKCRIEVKMEKRIL